MRMSFLVLSVCLCTMCFAWCPHRGQKRMSGLLGLELGMIVSHAMWFLGMGPGLPGRASSGLTAEPPLQSRYLFFEVGSQYGTQASCELLGSIFLP